jgi:hypothetical protein
LILPDIILRMRCPTAQGLFEEYAEATREYFEATDELSNVVGQHRRFDEQKEYVERVRKKCSTARLALEQHRAEHSCREE